VNTAVLYDRYPLYFLTKFPSGFYRCLLFVFGLTSFFTASFGARLGRVYGYLGRDGTSITTSVNFPLHGVRAVRVQTLVARR